MRTTAALFVLCALGATAGTAAASGPSAVDYEAAAGCPDRAGFLSEVRARTDAWEESATAPRMFFVRLSLERDGRARGSLVIATSGKRGAPRVLDAATCAEAARALSFIVALALDPDARAPEPTNTADPTTSPKAASEEPAPAATVNASPSPAPVARIESPTPPREQAKPAARARTLGWSAGLSAEILGLAAPGPVLGGGVFVGLHPSPSVALRLSVHRTLASSVTVEGTSTSMTWTTGRVDACFELFRAGRLGLGPCALVELGRLSAEGGGVDKTESPSRLWGAGGAAGRAELVLVDALRLELAAGALVPFERTEFTYRPALLAYRAPAVGIATSLSAAVRWR